MGFYLRKSLRVGPLRFNLSKSGVGVSAGIKGFRVGSGPRGNYVHMGRHGLYYRATLPRNRDRSRTPAPPTGGSGAVDSLAAIESADVAAMTDSSAPELLHEFERKREAIRLWPIAAGVTAALWIAGINSSWPGTTLIAVLALAIGATVAAAFYDQLRKTVVLFYELEGEIEASYQQLHDAFDDVAGCARVWHIEARGDSTDWKRNAGASEIVRRRAVRLRKAAPPYVKTNIAVPVLPAGRQTLYLFPDRVLVFEGGRVGAVPYTALQVSRTSTRFIEDQSVPADATVVGRTWKYVNKRGGPDRRFKDNIEIPIAQYEEMHLSSRSGLNELFQLSRVGAGAALEKSIAIHARVTDSPELARPGQRMGSSARVPAG